MSAADRGPAQQSATRFGFWTVALILAAAIALRAPLYGNPVIQSDEQYYLLVGDRMLHGAVPYIDIWDRKPIGLFLLFAGIRLLGGIGIVQYQLVATVFAAGTGLVLARLIAITAPARAAVAAGLIYLIWLDIFDGAGGQDPVFYNLFMAGAALLTFRAMIDKDVARLGTPAFLLVGIAIQLKYTVIPEGIFFGLLLLKRLWREGTSAARLLGIALGWIALALTPTILAWLAYSSAGHSREFAFANFLSIFGRGPDASAKEHLVELLQACIGAAPLLVLSIYAGWSAAPDAHASEKQLQRFALWWLAVALASVLLVGTFKGHYFLPLLLPLTISAAPPLTRQRLAAAVMLLGCVIAGFTLHDHVRRRGTRAQVNALVTLIGQRPPHCMFSFGSEPILYHLTRSCIPTRYAFRSLLRDEREAKALGVDSTEEVNRILAARPSMIVTRNALDGINPATAGLVERAVTHDYRLAGTVRVGSYLHYVYKLPVHGARAGPSASGPSDRARFHQ